MTSDNQSVSGHVLNPYCHTAGRAVGIRTDIKNWKVNSADAGKIACPINQDADYAGTRAAAVLDTASYAGINICAFEPELLNAGQLYDRRVARNKRCIDSNPPHVDVNHVIHSI